MDDIVLARTLRSQGYDERDLARMRRDGDLIPVRRGAYVPRATCGAHLR
jgi:hypothetical protein